MAAIPRSVLWLALAGAVGACLLGPPRETALGEGSPVSPVGGLAPDFTLTQTSTRDTLTLSAFSEQPVLLFFYDGGEMTSQNAIPYVNEWNRRYARDGLKVIAVHSPALEPLRVAYNALEVTSLARMTYPVGLDHDRAVYAAYGLGALPAYVVLKPGLEVIYSTADPKPYPQVETAIQGLLSEAQAGDHQPLPGEADETHRRPCQ